jgi:hypothetical protein
MWIKYVPWLVRMFALVLEETGRFLFFFLCLWSISLKLLRLVRSSWRVCRHLYFFVDGKWKWILLFCLLVFSSGALYVCMRIYLFHAINIFLRVYKHCSYYSKSVDRRLDKFSLIVDGSSRIQEPHIVILLLTIHVTTTNKLIRILTYAYSRYCVCSYTVSK